MTDSETSTVEAVVVAWSPVLTPLLISFIQGIVFFTFFLWKRGKDQKVDNHELFEPRQFTRAHRSPPAFDGGTGILGWARSAWSVSSEDLLQNVGLDSYMYLRFLRLGARLTLLGSVLSITILLPVYATGEARGGETEQFNQYTLARVANGSNRLWAGLVCWLNFVAFALYEMYEEYSLYAQHRYQFLAKGDADTPPDFKYSCRIENIPAEYRTARKLKLYFDRIFPGQVRETSVCLNATKLDKLVTERKTHILSVEKAVAATHASPEKPAPTAKKDAKMGVCGGTKVEAIPYHTAEIERLNREIDAERGALLTMAGNDTDVKNEVEWGSPDDTQKAPNASAASDIEITASGNIVGSYTNSGDVLAEPKPTEQSLDNQEKEDETEGDGRPSSTGFVTFTTLRAKQAAVQCEISGKKDRFDVYAAPEPSGVIWENVTQPLSHQRVTELVVACFWLVGVLFWAVPVSFVTSIANLNGIVTGFGLDPFDESTAWYGLVAGLLPVIFLQILMIVLYMAITMAATSVIKKKSKPEVDAYCLKWHQLFQFANLWLIIIGGSLFGQIETLLDDQGAVFRVIADAMPGAAVFLTNMINVASLGAFGLELSLIPAYGVALVMSLLQPEAKRTQRMLDDAKKPPSLVWGKIIPKAVFVFLIAVLYMPIVPLVQIFAFVYFGGSYIVMKHQCLHVYSAEFEGGGVTTWEVLFGYLMVCMYMAEIVFIAYMGLKEGPTQASLGFIPLVATIAMHMILNRNIRSLLANLSLEIATVVDEEGEAAAVDDTKKSSTQATEGPLYGQPNLKTAGEERGPLPYRRDAGEVME